MINVSSSFKENVKKDVRQVNEVVELMVDRAGYFRNTQYDLDYRSQIEAYSDNSATEITKNKLNSVIDKDPIMYKYASLEKDRLLLDGSFILPSEVYFNKNTGYVGNSLGGTGILQIVATDEIVPIYRFRNQNKITIYFEEGYATNFDVKIKCKYVNNKLRYDKWYTYEIRNNELNHITIDFSSIEEELDIDNSVYYFLSIIELDIEINSWSEPYRRARIRQVNTGETILLEKNNIIEVNINEETSLYNIDMPNSDMSIMLNNYNRDFDLLDKDSVLNRLTRYTNIHTFIGVSINNGSFEYIDMGLYKYSSYKENQDKTITLYGEGIINEYETKWIRLGSDYQSVSYNLSSIGIEPGDLEYDGYIKLSRTTATNLKEQLQAIAIFSSSYIKQIRGEYNNHFENRLTLNKILSKPLDKITLYEQIREPEIKKENKIKTVKMNTTTIGTLDTTEKVLYEDFIENVETTSGSIRIQMSFGTPVDYNSFKVYLIDNRGNETQLSEENYDVGSSYFSPNVSHYNSNLSNYEKVKIVGKEYNYTKATSTIGNENGIIEYNNEYLDDNFHKKRVSNYIINRQKDYRFRIEFNGDPSLEIGDAIQFETVDGWMIGNIEKLSIKYNGGLQETMEGICNVVR